MLSGLIRNAIEHRLIAVVLALVALALPVAPGIAQAADAPLCYPCGSKMQPAGSCYVCPSCGSTSGCS